MITTVTLNAAIDKTYHVPSFHLNQVNRTKSTIAESGGKGNNVAKVLHALKIPVTSTGVVGGYNGMQICRLLDEKGIRHDFTQTLQESRLCLNIVDDVLGSQTEILESGPEISQVDWNRFKDKMQQLAGQSEYVVMSGSLSSGLPVDSYNLLTKMIKSQGAKVIVDSSGPAFEQVLKAKPFMVKPNKEELAAVLKKETVTESEITQTIQRWSNFGIPIIAVSLGRDGAIVSFEGNLYKAVPPSMEVINPVGSGDAFVAGMTAGLIKGLEIKEMITLAIASGTANALEPQAGVVSLEKLKGLKKEILIENL